MVDIDANLALFVCICRRLSSQKIMSSCTIYMCVPDIAMEWGSASLSNSLLLCRGLGAVDASQQPPVHVERHENR